MGFASKSRKEAQQQQVQAMQMQQDAYKQAQQQAQQYQSGFNTRNAGVIGLQKQASNWLDRYAKGEDVATLNPAMAKTTQQAADTINNSLNFATNRIGDTAGHGDAGYNAKLQSATTRQLGHAVAETNMAGLQDELNNQRGVELDTSNFLNADARAGFGLSSDLFGMTNSIFNAATTRRQMEIQRSQMMMNNLMAGISGATSGFLGIAGLGGLGRAAGGGAAAGAASKIASGIGGGAG